MNTSSPNPGNRPESNSNKLSGNKPPQQSQDRFWYLLIAVLVIGGAAIAWWVKAGGSQTAQVPHKQAVAKASANPALETNSSANTPLRNPSSQPKARLPLAKHVAKQSAQHPANRGNHAPSTALNIPLPAANVAASASNQTATSSAPNLPNQPQSEPKNLQPPTWEMAVSGKKAEASVVINGVVTQLTPNQVGDFQRVYVKKGGSVQVTVSYPKGQPGDKVVAVLQDGGTIDGKGIAKELTLDKQHNVTFTADTTTEDGIYRVLLRNGSDRKIVNIWGGAEQPLKSVAATIR